MNRHEDAELRSRFAELRAHDSADAPPYRQPTHPNPRPVGRIALAAAALLLLALGLAKLATRGSTLPSVSTVLSWRAPTDQLLEYAASALYEVPRLRGSRLDHYIPPTTVFEGERR